MNRAAQVGSLSPPSSLGRLARAIVAATSLSLLCGVLGCGFAGIKDQNRPKIVSVFPADDQVLTTWPGEVRVTFDMPVTVLDPTSVGFGNTLEDIPARAFSDPSDPNSVVIIPVGGHFEPGLRHFTEVREGLVINSEGHYLYDSLLWHFIVPARPNAFVASSNGNVYEINPVDGTQVGATVSPAGFVAEVVAGGDDEVFVWLKNTGVGSDALAYFTPGSATMTTIPIAGETGTVRGLGFSIATDGKTMYATAFDGADQRVRVHRVSTTTRAEIAASLELTPVTPLPLVARRPAVDFTRNYLYVAHADGTGGGFLSVVDLATFTQRNVGGSAGFSVPMPDGAGDLTFGPWTDRLWMTLAEKPNAALLVITPGSYKQFNAEETTFTQGPVSSGLRPGEEDFLQGLGSYTGTAGLVFSSTDEISDGFVRDVLDDVGGVLQGSNRVGALLYDPGSHLELVFASNGTSTVMCTYDVYEFELVQIDQDPLTFGVQGISLATSAPGNVVSATFLRGLLP